MVNNINFAEKKYLAEKSLLALILIDNKLTVRTMFDC